jgi:hypothetical protein
MEIVDDPILSKTEISTIIRSLGGDFFIEKDIKLFVDTIYSGFADPYTYDKVYSDFLISYFGLDKEFVSQSAPVILKEKIFQKMFDGRASDEEYHAEVLKWNVDNLGLRFSFDDFESLEYTIQKINNKYGFNLSQPEQDFDLYWTNLRFDHSRKSLLKNSNYGDILIVDQSTVEDVITALNKIDYSFEKID